MSDYIKREDALELFEMVLESYKDAGIQNIKTMVAIAPQEFHLSEDNEIADFNFELDGWRNNLMEIESADVAPVRHGRWIEYGENKDGTHNICCSVCDGFFKSKGHANSCNTRNKYRYCHNCGARMDGGENE